MDIIEKARAYAYEEINTYGAPAPVHFEISYLKGQELAQQFNCDKTVVALGTIFMDIKLGEAKKNHAVKQHCQLSHNAAKEFFTKEEHNLSQEQVDKVLNAVIAHHGEVAYESKEAEICANADCYRFLTPRGIFAFSHMLGSRNTDFKKTLKFIGKKADEKWGILTLEECKKELEPYYKQLKNWLEEAKNAAM